MKMSKLENELSLIRDKVGDLTIYKLDDNANFVELDFVHFIGNKCVVYSADEIEDVEYIKELERQSKEFRELGGDY